MPFCRKAHQEVAVLIAITGLSNENSCLRRPRHGGIAWVIPETITASFQCGIQYFGDKRVHPSPRR